MPIDADAEHRILDAWARACAAGGSLPAEVARDVDALFAEAQPRVYVACRRIVGDEERARDLAQEALLVGYRKLDTFRGEGRLGTWLYGIAKGLALNASSPAALPPPRELLASLADALGLEGGDHGYAQLVEAGAA